MRTAKAIVTLSIDDLAWVSRKLIAHYAIIKKSNELTEEEKNSQIFCLVTRADRFGLTDLISFFGYDLHVIPLMGKDREFRMLLPKNCSENDLKILEERVRLLILPPTKQ